MKRKQPIKNRQKAEKTQHDDFEALRAYIHHTWHHLTRTHRRLLQAAYDPKIYKSEPPYNIYLSPHENLQKIRAELKDIMTSEDFGQIQLKYLPIRDASLVDPGLLYLPHSYVVPSERFNEQYGWDSYFIILGLLEDGQVKLAKDMVDNFIYELEIYEKILNANRSYYLDRSQPPLYTQMVLAVYEHLQDKAWLKRAASVIKPLHELWIRYPRRVPKYDLSRYYVLREKAAPEVFMSECFNERVYYEQAIKYFEDHIVKHPKFRRFYNPMTKQLTPTFYRADRSVRESGHDLSGKYGPFGTDVIHLAPVCLNTYLYKLEEDAAQIESILGHKHSSRMWKHWAKKRAEAINHYCWDSEKGYYFDYNFVEKRQNEYYFATTFLPLWAGIATKEQAAQVQGHLSDFEASGGICTSVYITGHQWDAPFGWAPLQYFAVKGLLNYGYQEDARRVARKYVHMLNQDFHLHGLLMEKYDVLTGASFTSSKVKHGYLTNEPGFGWTNGVCLYFLNKVLKDTATS